MTEHVAKAEHSGKLKIGNLEIPCFVTKDGQRVISGRGMTSAIGMKGRGQGITRITSHKTLKPFISNELALAIDSPIMLKGVGPKLTAGYEATILNDVCEAILTARDSGALLTEQEVRYSSYADMIMRSFAKVGVIALVDEATGYQGIRDREALQALLDKYLRKELAAWAKKFPDEFYQEMFRLKGWRWRGMSVNRPSVVGKYTNDIVYQRLAPGILNELEKRNPKNERGIRKSRHHQYLTSDVGHPALAQHLHAVIALMRTCSTWDQFKRLLQRAFPKKGSTMDLPLDDLADF